jgi:hypothetical protein
MARVAVLILLAAVGLTASWMLGYREGQQTGAFRLAHDMDASKDRDIQSDINIGRDQVCNEIRRYKISIAKDLNDNTQICDFPDL